jgi:group I intron endonuclease
MKQWIIYRHIHNESGRSYIGLTAQTMERRWASHVSKAKDSRGGRWHFPNAIRKHGPQAFSHEVLQICFSLEEANQAEQFWIWTYNTRNPLRGFNLNKGGHTPHSIKKNPWNNPEYRAKQCARIQKLWKNPIWVAKNRAASKAALNTIESKIKRSAISKKALNKPEILANISKFRKGKKLSPEHRASISASRIGKKASQETRIKIGVSNRGRKLSQESKLKISLAVKGKQLGERSNSAKFTNEQALHIRNSKERICDLARKLNVNRATISAIKNGKSYQVSVLSCNHENNCQQ